jgi:hypothetical protein
MSLYQILTTVAASTEVEERAAMEVAMVTVMVEIVDAKMDTVGKLTMVAGVTNFSAA